jgi:hypothetical protein
MSNDEHKAAPFVTSWSVPAAGLTEDPQRLQILIMAHLLARARWQVQQPRPGKANEAEARISFSPAKLIAPCGQ